MILFTYIALLSVWLTTAHAHPTISHALSSLTRFQYDPLTSDVACSIPTATFVEPGEKTETVTVFTTQTTTIWAPESSSAVVPENTVTLTTHTTSTTTIFPSGIDSAPTDNPSVPTCSQVSTGNAESALPDSQSSVSMSSAYQTPTHQLNSHGLLDHIDRKGQRLISKATPFDLHPRGLVGTRNTSAEIPSSEKKGGGGAAAVGGGLRSISSLTNPACKNSEQLVLAVVVVALGLLVLQM